jgi:stress response protein YsnF
MNSDQETMNPPSDNSQSPARAPATSSAAVLRLHEETAQISKELRESGTVSVSTRTLARDEVVSQDLAHTHVEVTTVPIGRAVDAIPAVREEGDVTIFPVMEEVLVVERRLMLKEEVHVRKVRTIERHQETVTLRFQEAVVSRTAETPPDADAVKSASAGK